MAILPITPTADQIDPESLSHLCLLDKVSISSFDEGILTHIGDGHMTAFITSNQDIEQQVLLLRFFNHDNQEKCTIVLVSRSKAWLQDDRTLIFPRSQGGLWRVDCSDSDEANFTELQDILTYFIKYENRYQMKNTLAMINPASCEVTQVVADNVHLDRFDEENVLNEEDFITSKEEKQGQKLPVCIGIDGHYVPQQNQQQEQIDPSKIRNVRLLYQSGNAMVTGSDWIAHALVLAGQALAKGIQSGGKMIEDRIEPVQRPIKLGDQERRVFEVVYNTTNTVTNMAASLVDMAVTAAIANINSVVYNDAQMQAGEPVQNATHHFGISALQAAVKIVGGVASAASAVLVSSRDSIIQMIHKKYGSDAGYMAEKTIGSGTNVAQMLVYFDARGISRRVVLRGANEFIKDKSTTSTSSGSQQQEEDRHEVVFENDWLEDELNETPTSLVEGSGTQQQQNEKKMEKSPLITV